MEPGVVLVALLASGVPIYHFSLMEMSAKEVVEFIAFIAPIQLIAYQHQNTHTTQATTTTSYSIGTSP